MGLYFALDHFTHFIWGTEKPVLVLTDNKSATQFFQSKAIPPSLWNFLDRILLFKLVIAHIPGRANYAADFLSRVQTDPSQTIQLKLTDRIPVKEIEIKTVAKSPDVSLSCLETFESLFSSNSSQIGQNVISELKQKGISDDLLLQIQLQTKTNTEPDDISGLIRLKYCKNEINAILMRDPSDQLNDLLEKLNPLDLKVEQAKDEVIKNVVQWKLQNHIDDLQYASFALKKYKKQFERLVLIENILCRQFDHTGKVKYLQYCLPKHLWKEVIYRLQNSPTAGHVGIVRTVQEFRKRFYFPGFVEYFVEMIKNCLTCIQQKAISNKSLRTFMQPLSSLQLFPGNLLQIDIVGPLPSTLYEYVLTGIDVFSKYLFAVPLTRITATVIATELTKIFFQHSYFPHTIISDLGTNLAAELMHELAKLLEIKIGHATLKHAECRNS